MTVIKSTEAEENALRLAAQLMAVSVRTAPKTRGIDHIVTLIVTGDEKERLAQMMEQKAKRLPFFKRDAANLRKSPVALLIGVQGTNTEGIDCGACGYPTCDAFSKAETQSGEDFTGPNCIFKAIDLGIALGSAGKVASDLSIDNRLMYTVGAAAKALGLLDADVIIGIPLSASGKNIYFDRK